MAKSAHVGVDGIARKIKKMYVGVDSKARKVKKGYIGVGGVALPFFSAESDYLGAIEDLSHGRYSLAGASVGNYALFAGGYWYSDDQTQKGTLSTVDAYNASLVRSTPTALTNAVSRPAGASVGNYALFAGGYMYYEAPTHYYSNVVNAYNASLVRSTATKLSVSRSDPAGASVGNYALFAGGSNGQSDRVATVDAYNSSLVRSTPTELTNAVSNPAGASVGNYALFAGGYWYYNSEETTSYYSSAVNAYNASLVKSTPSSLSVGRDELDGASVGNYALFAGGYNNSYKRGFSGVDAYNSSLVRYSAAELSSARKEMGTVSTNNYALFAGGSGSGLSDTVDAYNASLTRCALTPLSGVRSSLAGASVGNYALFAGGIDHNASPESISENNYKSEIVEAYDVNKINIGG